MTIVNTKKGTLWPGLALIIFRFGFHDIKNDSNTILIIVANNSLIRIGSIASNKTITLVWVFRILVTRQAFAFTRLTKVDFASNLIKIKITSTETCTWCNIEEGFTILVTGCGTRLCSLTLFLVFIFDVVFSGRLLIVGFDARLTFILL